MPSHDLLDPVRSFFFYKGRVAKVEELNDYGKVAEWYSTVAIGHNPVEKARIEAFVAGDPPFVVKGLLLSKFAEIAGPVVAEILDGRYRRACRFAMFGASSIELIRTLAGVECSAETYPIPDELLDQRERLVLVLNEAIERTFSFI